MQQLGKHVFIINIVIKHGKDLIEIAYQYYISTFYLKCILVNQYSNNIANYVI